MGAVREKYEVWLARHPRPPAPAVRRQLFTAIDAFEKSQKVRRLTPALVRPIVVALCKPGAYLMNAADFLGALGESHALARDEIVALSSDPRSHVRFNSLLCLRKGMAREFVLAQLRAGLLDKSSEVRWKAADKCLTFRTKELVPELEDALARDRNAKARRTLDFSLKLVRDGYIVSDGDSDEPDRVWVTVQTNNGAISSQGYSKSELKREGIEAIAARARIDPY